MVTTVKPLYEIHSSTTECGGLEHYYVDIFGFTFVWNKHGLEMNPATLAKAVESNPLLIPALTEFSRVWATQTKRCEYYDKLKPFFVKKDVVTCGGKMTKEEATRLLFDDLGVFDNDLLATDKIDSFIVEEAKKLLPSLGYVYLLRGQHGLHKIGISKTPKSRFRAFNVVLPFDFEVSHLIYCKNAAQAEKALHAYYADKRVRGEWFDLSTEDTNKIKEIEKIGLPLYSARDGWFYLVNNFNFNPLDC